MGAFRRLENKRGINLRRKHLQKMYESARRDELRARRQYIYICASCLSPRDRRPASAAQTSAASWQRPSGGESAYALSSGRRDYQAFFFYLRQASAAKRHGRRLLEKQAACRAEMWARLRQSICARLPEREIGRDFYRAALKACASLRVVAALKSSHRRRRRLY